MKAEKESCLSNERKNNPFIRYFKALYQVILLFGQAMNSCLYIIRFNVLMSFVGDKKIAESMLKDNATVFSETENMLRGPKYEALVARYLSSKLSWFKKLFGFIKNQG